MISGSTILVVEDDESHVFALEVALSREGLVVESVRDGRDALEAVGRFDPDLIVLDVMLPGISGLDVCRELRARSLATPVIIVSSRQEELDVVVGIEVGADDYLGKPYRMRELLARIGALLRRHEALKSQIRSTSGTVDDGALEVGAVRLDPARHEVEIGDRQVNLALREFQLLQELLENAGRVVTRDELLDRIWGHSYVGDPRILATLVGRIRRHIGTEGQHATITTIRGVGYRFDEPRAHAP
ncbi:MAG TPA: response regulator transcription factor [Acidimicrobiales bacterium]|nr:response regulator transcription factor [Acidimicrobiales bacterium]